jgi:calcium/calmodulin-dependent protein kinase I
MSGTVTPSAKAELDFEEKYKFGRTLGKGSFATVRLATCLQDNQQYAVKMITKKSLTEKDKLSLASEVQIVMSVSHPNIVQVIEIFSNQKYVNIVMECMIGGELFDRIVKKSFYSEQEAKAALKHIANGIQYCHERNIAHRDLKPENLLYQNGNVDSILKLADFGLARILGPDEMLHNVCGTPGYVAPEILAPTPYYGIQVDMWSIGVILYILLCGYPPFYDDDNQRLFQKIRRAKFDFDEKSWGKISPEAKDLVTKLLVVDPAERLTASQVLAHPWCAAGAGGQENLDQMIPNLQHYNAARRMKKAIRSVFFAQLLVTNEKNKSERNMSTSTSTRSMRLNESRDEEDHKNGSCENKSVEDQNEDQKENGGNGSGGDGAAAAAVAGFVKSNKFASAAAAALTDPSGTSN